MALPEWVEGGVEWGVSHQTHQTAARSPSSVHFCFFTVLSDLSRQASVRGGPSRRSSWVALYSDRSLVLSK